MFDVQKILRGRPDVLLYLYAMSSMTVYDYTHSSLKEDHENVEGAAPRITLHHRQELIQAGYGTLVVSHTRAKRGSFSHPVYR